MNSFEEGYRHFEKNIGGLLGAEDGVEYIRQIQGGIDKTIAEMKNTVIQRQNTNNSFIKGFVAEDWHAGTFNTDVMVKGGKQTYAAVDKSNDPIKDIDIFHKDTVSSWQSKYYHTPEATAKALSNHKYSEVNKVAPSEQVVDNSISDVAHKQALRNMEIRPEVAQDYEHTAKFTKSKIEESIYSSKELSNSEALQIVEEIREGTFEPEKYGLTTDNFIHINNIIQQSLKSGLTAAMLTTIIKIAPEIYKIIMNMIEQGYIDKEQLMQSGFVVLESSVEGFIRGTVAAAITSTLKSGLVGNSLKTIDPTFISYGTVIVMNAIYNSIKVVNGKIQPIEFVDACARDIVLIYFSFKGGMISQGIIQIPILGFMIGSLVGSIIGSFVYGTSKHICLSFCIQSGFTFFGLVKQDYILPEGIIKKLGLSTFQFKKIAVSTPNIKKSEIKQFQFNKFETQSIQIQFLRRGVIGISKVGYV